MRDPLDELLELDRVLGVFELLRRHTPPSRLFEVDRRVRLVAAIENRWNPEDDDAQGALFAQKRTRNRNRRPSAARPLESEEG